jgi:hypothetical protein
MHYTRLRRQGDVAIVGSPRRAFGAENSAWIGDKATYRTVHNRIRYQRGSASEQVCSCGAPARHWAYDHADPEERIGPDGPYSLDLDRYAALCVPCHKRLDLDHEQP